MALDGIVTRALAKDLSQVLNGLRVDKIYQVSEDEIILHFRKNKLLISSSGNSPRIYLTEEKKDNPIKAPIFSMVLRKHLIGANLIDIVQYGNDRVLELKFDAWNDFSEKVQKSLIIEIMGRHSNIILVDENKIIIDAIKRVNENMSRVRQVLPHLEYKYLEDSEKLKPLEASEDEIKDLFYKASGNKAIGNYIFSCFEGFSKTIGYEISTRASVDPSRPISSLEESDKDNIIKATQGLINDIKNNKFIYKAYLDGDKVVEFHVLDLKYLAGIDAKDFETSYQLLDSVYSKIENDDKMGQKSQALKKTVNSKLTKDKTKLTNLKKELLEAENREIYRVYADILSANLHNVQAGQNEIRLQNFYDPELEEITIPLDSKIPAPQNAQKFYKKYTKLKTAEKVITEQIEDTSSEVAYLESVLSQIALAENVDDLEDTKDELINQGYIKRNRARRKKADKLQVNYKEYGFEGYTILLGRNNRENDFITHKVARKDDIWLHVQAIPGSHVIIKTDGKTPPEEVIKYAARIAAYNSKARNSGSVEVDYTEKKNVKRHPANKPGLVNYVDFNTILVDSSEI